MTDAPTSATTSAAQTVPRLSLIDTVRVGTRVLLPVVGRGAILRRPAVVATADRLDLDRAAIHELQRIKSRYGGGPVLLRLPFRRFALVLDADDARRVLDDSPEPFSPASREKRAALAQFQPEGVLISDLADRQDRRRFNEGVLDTPLPIHRMAGRFLAAVREEADELLAEVDRTGQLSWDGFIVAWWRMIRRVMLGDGARDDHLLTDLLAELRSKANNAYLVPRDRRLRRRFYERLNGHLARAEPGSLAELVMTLPRTERTQPHQQVPQWLFASDPAGIATIRTLALLAAHPAHAARVRDELADRDLSVPQDLPLLRASVLESLRLWPTTPAILRDTTRETTWRDGRTLPAGAGVLVFAPFFHRDDRRLDVADRFAPEVWSDGRLIREAPFVPFSDGPVVCPGRNLVLLLTSSFLAQLLHRHEYRLDPPDRLDPDGSLPSVLNPFDLRFDVTRPTSLL